MKFLARKCLFFKQVISVFVRKNSQLERNPHLKEFIKYRKDVSSNMSFLEAIAGFFRLLMKGIFGPYLSKHNRGRIYAIIYWSELYLFLVRYCLDLIRPLLPSFLALSKGQKNFLQISKFQYFFPIWILIVLIY